MLTAQTINRAEWTEKWHNSRDYTLELLAEIPADSLDFAPTPDQMTFREQLQHISGNMIFLPQRFLDYKPADFDLEAAKAQMSNKALSKEELAALISAAYAYAEAALTALDDERLEEKVDFFTGDKKTRRQILWLLQDHATHHRGQVIVYARLLGVKPPRYRGW